MATPVEATFSELLQRPKDTVAKLYQTVRKGIRLYRRGDEDLYLTTAARAEAAVEVVDSTTRVFAALLREDSDQISRLTDGFAAAFPWLRFLPEEQRHQFVRDLIDTARASTDLGIINPIAQVITEWKHTAEVYADPELQAALMAEYVDEDYGPAPEPGVAGE
ncbi:hypothetical protein [Streptomyces griseocarneus]|uniref:hypothetical protein n=1 Tax=Streptomyces griseocarneus TaxID=51201 RepID=UPI00167E0FA7|nr:hypothetical protein [Streptomyces griseocarneus]MBZ6475015.1 hypothetical protein [Streptomyces griseocarneus]GHG62762.1 hypothetical protein GCM10018779_31770 [Streptomyces griseocarneus]